MAVAGAKNAVLPIAMATLLVHGRTVLHAVPCAATDVVAAASILSHFGLEVELDDGVMMIDNAGLQPSELPATAWQSTRYSALLAAILPRVFGNAVIHWPGGCRLGQPRPLDIYFDGLTAFGAGIRISRSRVEVRLEAERCGTFRLRYPSVGATEALVLFCVLAPGTRTLENCAREPEIVELCAFLQRAGAQIDGLGGRTLTIEGVERLRAPAPWTILPDRIEAATFAVLAAIVERDITLAPVVLEHLVPVLNVLTRMGVPWQHDERGGRLHVLGSRTAGPLTPIAVTAEPYPSLATDVQPLLAALCLKAGGTSLIIDRVFPGRFAYVNEFRRLGASVETVRHGCRIDGARPLRSSRLTCHDIRGGAACVLAALLATGTSELGEVAQIHRGYAGLFDKLRALNISSRTLNGAPVQAA